MKLIKAPVIPASAAARRSQFLLSAVSLALTGLLPLEASAACAYGPEQCQPGYVWREAFSGDKACVTGESRAQAAADNAQAKARELKPGSCAKGFVWREINPEDKVCVTPAVRTQVANDNAQAMGRRDPACAVPAAAAHAMPAMKALAPPPPPPPPPAQAAAPAAQAMKPLAAPPPPPPAPVTKLAAAPALLGGKLLPPTPAAPAPAAAPNPLNKMMVAPAPATGLGKIMSAGDLTIAGAPDAAGTPFQVSNFSPATGNQGARIATQKGFRGKVDNAVRKVDDAIFLSDANAMYPGALIQGQGFASGNFTTITIPRAGGRIAISNLNLANGAVYNKTLTEVTRESVQTAIQEMLAQGVVGTAAGATFNSYETSSQSKFLFDLGVDVRYGSVAVNGQLNVQNASTKNYVFATFKQKYYDVSFSPPTAPVDVFKDGANFTDPQNQIRPGNPPLYVNKVTYGRMVFFVAESESSSSDLSAALNAAYNGGASVKVNSKMTASEVLNSSRISYVVVGGNAGIALKPIASSNGDMFTAVKAAIANEGAANYSPSSPGVPIAYSLSYLKNNGAAMMAYSTGPYDQSDIQYTNLPKKWSTTATSTMDFNDPDNDENSVQIDIDWNAGLPNNVIEFRLVQPAGHTWNKWMKILRSNDGTAEEVQVGSGTVSKTVGLYTFEVGRNSDIIFSKAKILGIKTPVFSLDDGFEYLQPGSRVTFTWLRDTKGQQ